MTSFLYCLSSSKIKNLSYKSIYSSSPNVFPKMEAALYCKLMKYMHYKVLQREYYLTKCNKWRKCWFHLLDLVIIHRLRENFLVCELKLAEYYCAFDNERNAWVSAWVLKSSELHHKNLALLLKTSVQLYAKHWITRQNKYGYGIGRPWQKNTSIACDGHKRADKHRSGQSM